MPSCKAPTRLQSLYSALTGHDLRKVEARVMNKYMKKSYCRYGHLWGIYRVMQSAPIPTLRSCKKTFDHDLYYTSRSQQQLPPSFLMPSHFAIVASAPLAFTTPSPEFCAGIATGRPRAFDVKATISLSISSRVSLARSSTSEG
jgi:hypothetical protein